MKILTPQNEAGWDLAPINPSTGKLSEDIIPDKEVSVAITTGNGLTGSGTSSSPLKATLASFNEQNANITINNLFRLVAPTIQFEANDSIDINCDNVQLNDNVTLHCGVRGVINIGAAGNIKLNGKGINTEFGLLQLGQNGIINILQKQECSYLAHNMADVSSYAPFASIASADICYLHTWTGTNSATITIGYINSSGVTTNLFYRPRMIIINYDNQRTILLGENNISVNMTVGKVYAIPVLQAITNNPSLVSTAPAFIFPMVTLG